MDRRFGTAPSAEEMEKIAETAYARLPAQFTEHLGDIVFQVQDFAEPELLREMSIEEPYELTGVYEGIPMSERSVEHSGTLPDRIRLFRLPILLEWCERGDETLEHLIHHVLVHEIGHHFGLSDADMHALEDEA
ncbi:metallopeptidase family protein [Sphingomicrobium sediminis]|uniref:Metallopeptidase family protein n=1 Tax=Sphingomicrobium sediminis TaxID=2950949 RepID=A0A9X2EIV1_9SPHN|nr:metallopeptidase family protein [Sphingomicrobium sediminis]MCM8558276.1 metallopeptidase family protein [Sphingomicrobium sediminis]